MAGANPASSNACCGALRAVRTRRRIVTPTHGAWKDAGIIHATLWARLLAARRRVEAALANDVLIALTPRPIGAAVATRNGRDFRFVREVQAFDLEVV